MNSIYYLQSIKKKNGEPSSRKEPILNNAKNPRTITISDAIIRINNFQQLPKNLVKNIESIIELRDNSVHFVNDNTMVKEIQELGFACIKNYMSIIQKWGVEIDLSEYNFYLMPLAYVDSKIYAESILTSETKNYLDFVKDKMISTNDDDFDIAISIDINFKKTNSFDGLGIYYDKNGVAITLTEENIREKYPLSHKDILTKSKARYSDFKQNSIFNSRMKMIKQNKTLYYSRILDPGNNKSQAKPFYSTNIWQELDKYYIKK